MFNVKRHPALKLPLKAHRPSACRGQAMIEYAIVVGVMVAMMAVLSLFLTTISEYGERILDMIASDYP